MRSSFSLPLRTTRVNHLAALLDELRAVAGRAKVIRNRVRELVLDHLRLLLKLLMQDRSRHRAESMPGDLGTGVVA